MYIQPSYTHTKVKVKVEESRDSYFNFAKFNFTWHLMEKWSLTNFGI